MFTTSRIATSVLAAAGAALAAASPALADPDPNFGPGASLPHNPYTHSAAARCVQDVVTAPLGGATAGEVLRHCANGHVLAEAIHHAQG